MILVLLVTVAFAGWIAGMLTFRASRLWCRYCGQTLVCPGCLYPGALRTTTLVEPQRRGRR